MNKVSSAGLHRAIRRLTALALALLTLMSCMGTAFAEETAKMPAEALDTYVHNGITYYNVKSPNFASPPHYLCDLMAIKSAELGNRSMAQMWLETGVGMAFDAQFKDKNLNAQKTEAINAMMNAINTQTAQQSGSYNTGYIGAFYATNIESAAKKLFSSTPAKLLNMNQVIDLFYPYNKNNDDELNAARKNQDVVATFCYGYNDNCYVFVEVYFTDFQAVALMPDNSGTNYVTTTLKDEKKPERTYASNVKNMTLATVNATQNVSTSWSASVTSTVNHSSSYSFSEALKIGGEATLKILKFSQEFTLTATQAFTNGWSKATTDTKSGTVSESVSVSLPPYTNVLLEQGSSTTESETKYNCPIGLKYRTLVKAVSYCPAGTNVRVKKESFGPDARLELYNRAIRDGDLDIDENVHWSNVLAIDGMRDRITRLTSHVPMSPVGATFHEKLDTTYTEVKNIAPLEPLAVVKILPPDVSIVSSQQQSYNNLNYLHADMKVGESSYTNYLKLRGENAFEAEYYGFSFRNGHWIVVKPDGTEWTDDTAPVKVEKDAATGYNRYTAVRPGTCFLKYVIDENCYSTAGSDTCTKNSDLVSTAALEITVSGVKENVSPVGTITVSGNYFGFVGKEPERLDSDNGLKVSIQDMSGKELDKPYHWEKKELDSRGIQFNEENKVSFTKTGKYHVRAVCDEIAAKSDWYEIEVHNYTFTAEGPNIMASCTDPQCDDVMFTLHAPEKTVYGDGKSAWASVTGKIPGMTPPNVEYMRGTEKLSAPPRTPGTYTASITIGGAKAEVEYTIAQAVSVVTELPVASLIPVGCSLSSSHLTGGKANTDGSFTWSEEGIYPTLEDSDKALYQVTFFPFDENFAPAFVYVTVPVVIARPHMTVRPGGKNLVYTGKAQELIWPGEAEDGKLSYGVSRERDIDPDFLDFSEEVPTAVEAGTYYIWYAEQAFDDIYIYDSPETATIEKAVPSVEFPVTQLLVRDEAQPLIVDPVITPSQGVTIYYSLGDTENELLSSPTAKELGDYTVYYRIESSNPSLESVPYGDPVRISIQSALVSRLPDFTVSLDSWTYGDAPNTPNVTGNAGLPVSFRYKAWDDSDEDYTDTVPTDAGDYTVLAVVTSPDYYGTVTASADFRISKRTPVRGVDFDIEPNVTLSDGTYKPLVDISVKEGTTLKLWCSFDQRNTLAGIPKKRDPGTYEIWYKVSGDSNYEELNEWNGPVMASILEQITVTVTDAAKIYDGKPMNIPYHAEGLLNGYTVSDIVFSDSMTEVGEKTIQIESLKILDAEGHDISDACSVNLIPGRLIVLDEPDLILPAMLRSIEPETFAGISAESVMLDKKVEVVFSRAFENCKQLKSFIVCGADTYIEPDALKGCESVIVCAPDDSAAHLFAMNNSIPFFTLMD